MHFAPIGLVLALFTLLVSALDVDWQKTQVLVVHDPDASPERDVLSTLFQLNEDYNVTFAEYSDLDNLLFLGGDNLYNHVVFLPSSKRAVAAKELVNKHNLLEFFNNGGNVLAVGSSTNSLPDQVRLFLNEAGIFPAPKNFAVASHFDKKVTLNSKNSADSLILSEVPEIDYDGTAALLSNSELVFPVIKAPKLSYCANPKDKYLTSEKTWSVGEQGFLAAAFQGLNNARGLWVGSIDLLAEELVQWVFQQSGVLKLQFAHHYKTDEPNVSNNTLYRIKDEVYYTIGVSELKNGKWVPFIPSRDDDVIQLSFKMLDPYQRLNLTLLGPGASREYGENDLSIFYVEFKLPDHHGMFTFDLDYKRDGLSFIEDKQIVAVRHLANDEFKRSWDISNSWLYVASAFFVVVAWFFFIVNFLFIGNEKPEVKTVKKTVKKNEEKAEKAEKSS